MFGWHYGDWGWGAAAMGVLMVAFWAFVIYGIVWLVKQSSDRPASPLQPPDPRSILDRRFAEGEIDEQEYRSRLDVLTGTPHERAP